MTKEYDVDQDIKEKKERELIEEAEHIDSMADSQPERFAEREAEERNR